MLVSSKTREWTGFMDCIMPLQDMWPICLNYNVTRP